MSPAFQAESFVVELFQPMYCNVFRNGCLSSLAELKCG